MNILAIILVSLICSGQVHANFETTNTQERFTYLRNNGQQPRPKCPSKYMGIYRWNADKVYIDPIRGKAVTTLRYDERDGIYDLAIWDLFTQKYDRSISLNDLDGLEEANERGFNKTLGFEDTNEIFLLTWIEPSNSVSMGRVVARKFNLIEKSESIIWDITPEKPLRGLNLIGYNLSKKIALVSAWNTEKIAYEYQTLNLANGKLQRLDLPINGTTPGGFDGQTFYTSKTFTPDKKLNSLSAEFYRWDLQNLDQPETVFKLKGSDFKSPFGSDLDVDNKNHKWYDKTRVTGIKLSKKGNRLFFRYMLAQKGNKQYTPSPVFLGYIDLDSKQSNVCFITSGITTFEDLGSDSAELLIEHWSFNYDLKSEIIDLTNCTTRSLSYLENYHSKDTYRQYLKVADFAEPYFYDQFRIWNAKSGKKVMDICREN